MTISAVTKRHGKTMSTAGYRALAEWRKAHRKVFVSDGWCRCDETRKLGFEHPAPAGWAKSWSARHTQ